MSLVNVDRLWALLARRQRLEKHHINKLVYMTKLKHNIHTFNGLFLELPGKPVPEK